MHSTYSERPLLSPITSLGALRRLSQEGRESPTRWTCLHVRSNLDNRPSTAGDCQSTGAALYTIHRRSCFLTPNNNPMHGTHKTHRTNSGIFGPDWPGKRCGAYARRTGLPCRAPAMRNGRCRMHGGKSTGAPRGSRNGNYKHGHRTQERIEAHRESMARIRMLIVLGKRIGMFG